MNFDKTKCLYTLAVGGLIPNNIYKWKVIKINFIEIFFNYKNEYIFKKVAINNIWTGSYG